VRADTARLFDEVQRLRDDLDRYAERTAKDLDASRQEVRSLSRRMDHLEQLIKRYEQAGASTVSMRVPASSKSLFTFLGRPTMPADSPDAASRA
jgi:hypothetical protein